MRIAFNDNDAPRWQLTLFRGSPSDAYRTYWSNWDRKEGPLWAHVALVVVFNTVIAVFITMVVLAFSGGAPWPAFTAIFPVSQWIGFSIIVLFGLGDVFIGSQRLHTLGPLTRVVYYIGGSVIGVAIGVTAWSFMRFGDARMIGGFAHSDSGILGTLGFSVVTSSIVYQVVSARTKAAQAMADVERERARTLAAQSAATEANLNLLQAQIEPHFLFNTLANVSGLIEAQPETARRMLENFIHYLRASLAVTREPLTTLGHEADLVESYLSIFQVRMGDRLSFSVRIDPALRGLAIAPMLFQPLVENAIEHGLEPTVEGGRIDVDIALADSATVRVTVADTGLGFGASTSGGIGLANVRERLHLLYGNRASLAIADTLPRGTTVTVTFPRT